MNNIVIYGLPIILFHLLRNISLIYYVFLAAYLFIVISSSGFHKTKDNLIILIGYLFLVIYIATLSISIDRDNFILGLFRLFYIGPIILFFFLSNLTQQQTDRVWKIFFSFILLSTMSIFYQSIFGPIEWFAQRSERAGTDRFASLTGSLTSYGGTVGVGILTAAYLFSRNILALSILIIIFMLGSLLSLQKMAIGFSIVTIFIYLFFIGEFKKTAIFKRLLIYSTLSFSFIYIGTDWLQAYYPNHIAYVQAIFTSNANTVGDVAMSTSIINRLVDLPLKMVSFWGVERFLIGLGVYGGAGGLGYSDLPMAHNFLFETLSIFGILISFFIFIFIFKYGAFSFKIISHNHSNSSLNLSAWVFLTLLFTNIFSGALFYHPVIGTIFWFATSNLYKARHQYV